MAPRDFRILISRLERSAETTGSEVITTCLSLALSLPAVTWSPDKGPALIDQNVLCPTMSSWRLAISECLYRISNEAPNQQVVRS